MSSISTPSCRFCGTPLTHGMVDLGMSPLCESFLPADHLDRMEPFYPLDVRVCASCLLVQLREYVTASEIFSEYAYFSSFSDSWVRHAQRYAEAMTTGLGLDAQSKVVELASNDGYLLQHFVRQGIPALGVEPAANVAAAATERGVPTRVGFFGRDLARQLVAEGSAADLIVGNNVLAQVPDLNDFVGGIKILLKRPGTVTLEFPHLLRTIEGNQFDQIYHEHFSYFSLLAVERIAAAHGLLLYDVEELPTHGGSLRIFLRHADMAGPAVSSEVDRLREAETSAGLADPTSYARFGARVAETKRKLLGFLIEAKSAGRRIAGYGAPGKGNTLLNYCGIRTDFLDYLVDRNPYKHGRFSPGTHIPIFPPDRIDETKPDLILILPWNLKTEIMQQMHHVAEWGCQFVVPIPEVQLVDPRRLAA